MIFFNNHSYRQNAFILHSQHCFPIFFDYKNNCLYILNVLRDFDIFTSKIFARLCDKAYLNNPNGAQRNNSRRRSPYNTLTTPRPITRSISPSKVHLQNEHNGSTEPNLGFLKTEQPDRTPTGAVSAEPSAPVSRCETHHHERMSVICVARAMYICTYVVYMCTLHSPCWGYIFSFAAGWTWEC